MKRFFKALGIVVALVGVGIVSAFAVVALLLRQEEVRVPDLTGQDIVTVIEMVTQQGLQLKVDRREPHSTLPRDTVIAQLPAPGVGIKKGRQVHVTVSQGPTDMQAPKLVGENFRKADMVIRRAGFSPGMVSRVSSETADRDEVIAQVPDAGSTIERGGKINLLVSSGKRVQMFVMPKLTGKKIEEAVKAIDHMGLQHRIITKTSGDPLVPLRMVINQKPSAGSPVTADAMVDIVVSK